MPPASPHVLQLTDKALRQLNPKLDSTDFTILQRRAYAYALRPEPTGHFIDADAGPPYRITRVRVDLEGATPRQCIQICWARAHYPPRAPALFLGDATVEYSGLDWDLCPEKPLVETGEIRLGRFWFFHHDDQSVQPKRIDVRLPCKLWSVPS